MFKKLICRHETEHIGNHIRYYSRLSLRQCRKCGKYFIYDKHYDKYSKAKDIDWHRWERIVGANYEL